MRIAKVPLPNGTVISCLQKHEVPIINREVMDYLSNGLQLAPGDTVFDVGAHIGLFTLAAYEHCKQNLNVYAFEPVQAIFEVLRVNMERHGSGEQMKIFPFGFSSSAKSVSLAYYPKAPVLSTVYPLEEVDLKMVEEATLNEIMHLDDAPLVLRCLRCMPAFLRRLILHYPLKRALTPETVTSQMQTLSQFLCDHRIERIDLLKVDVEKSELEILRGIKDHDWPIIKQVIVEVHDLERRLEVIMELLRQNGLTEIEVKLPLFQTSNIYTIYAMRP
jgi:FkbM family methyltransferase